MLTTEPKIALSFHVEEIACANAPKGTGADKGAGKREGYWLKNMTLLFPRSLTTWVNNISDSDPFVTKKSHQNITIHTIQT